MKILALAMVGLFLAGASLVYAQGRNNSPNITFSPNVTVDDTFGNASGDRENGTAGRINVSKNDTTMRINVTRNITAERNVSLLPNTSRNRTSEAEENLTITFPPAEKKHIIKDADKIIIIAELDRSVDTPITAISQANVLSGAGWALRSEYGTFIEVVLVERVFVDNDRNEYILTYGLIRTDRGDEIFIYQDSRDRDLDEFQIRENGQTIGEFILDREQSRGAFTVWEGDVRFTNGEEGYELEFGTTPQFIEEVATKTTLDRSLNARLENRKRVLTLGERLRELFRRNRN